MGRMGMTLVVAAAVVLVARGLPAIEVDRPLALTRAVLRESTAIVRGSGDRKEKLRALSEVLRDFLDTDELARRAARKHLATQSAAEEQEFLRVFHEFFVRTYVQRLLLLDGPGFAFGEETVGSDEARVATEVVTPHDRISVDYILGRTSTGWRARDIVVEDVSLAQNFRAQFDAAVARDSFQGVVERLRAKLATASES